MLAGAWCLFTSYASCVLTRGGMGFPWNGAIGGLFSGSIIGLASGGHSCRETLALTMGTSAVLSIASHYVTESQQKDGAAHNDARCGAERPSGHALDPL